MAAASDARLLDKALGNNKCRLCSRCAPLELMPPFVAELLGLGPSSPGPGLLGGSGPEAQVRRERQPGEAEFQPRSEEEVQEAARKWVKCAHPRAQGYFRAGGEDALLNELSKIARGIDRSSDPLVPGSASQCVIWHGGQSAGEAVMEVSKPGMPEDTTAFVNRALVFMFASDESFALLARLPKASLAMSCGNQLCVNMAHITIATTDSSSSGV